MPDAEYQRIWRQRQRDIKDGRLTAGTKQPHDHAAYMRDWRKNNKVQKAKAPLPGDEAIDAAIRARGRQLTEMMRTPMSMWPAEWLLPEDDNE